MSNEQALSPCCASSEPKVCYSSDGEVCWVRCPQCGDEGTVEYREDLAVLHWNNGKRPARPSPARDEVPGLRPEVLAFAHLMERQLRANDHKPGWKYDLAMNLIPRIREETDELDEATVRLSKQLGWGDAALYLQSERNNVAREAADVGNFAMMVADVCGVLKSQPPSTVGEDAP